MHPPFPPEATMVLEAKTPLVRKERPPRRTQEERTAAARSSVINAAISLIVERGFAHTTMADVAGLHAVFSMRGRRRTISLAYSFSRFLLWHRDCSQGGGANVRSTNYAAREN